MSTAANVRDSARALLGVGTSDAAGSDTEMLVWLNSDFAALRRRVAEVIPDRYSAIVAFDLGASVSTYTIVATDFERIRKVGRRWGGSGTAYLPLPLAPYASAESPVCLSWRQRALIIDFFPPTSAPNTAGVDGYQLSYVTKAATLTASDTIDLPAGFERILEAYLAARGKIRLGESPSQLYEMARGWERDELLAIANAHPGSPDSSADLTGMY